MTETAKRNWKKPLRSGLIGAVCGAVGMSAFLALGEPELGALRGSGLAAGGVAIVYLWAGVFCCLGTLMPAMGAKVMEVDDAEEVREQRALLLGSGLSVTGTGAALMTLVFAAPGGPVPPWVTVGAVVAALAVNLAVAIVQFPRYDELWQRLQWEGSALAMMLLFPVLFLWGGAAHVGWVAGFDPLGVIAAVAGCYLVGTFWAVTRRGLWLRE